MSSDDAIRQLMERCSSVAIAVSTPTTSRRASSAAVPLSWPSPTSAPSSFSFSTRDSNAISYNSSPPTAASSVAMRAPEGASSSWVHVNSRERHSFFRLLPSEVGGGDTPSDRDAVPDVAPPVDPPPCHSPTPSPTFAPVSAPSSRSSPASHRPFSVSPVAASPLHRRSGVDELLERIKTTRDAVFAGSARHVSSSSSSSSRSPSDAASISAPPSGSRASSAVGAIPTASAPSHRSPKATRLVSPLAPIRPIHSLLVTPTSFEPFPPFSPSPPKPSPSASSSAATAAATSRPLLTVEVAAESPESVDAILRPTSQAPLSPLSQTIAILVPSSSAPSPSPPLPPPRKVGFVTTPPPSSSPSASSSFSDALSPFVAFQFAPTSPSERDPQADAAAVVAVGVVRSRSKRGRSDRHDREDDFRQHGGRAPASDATRRKRIRTERPDGRDAVTEPADDNETRGARSERDGPRTKSRKGSALFAPPSVDSVAPADVRYCKFGRSILPLPMSRLQIMHIQDLRRRQARARGDPIAPSALSRRGFHCWNFQYDLRGCLKSNCSYVHNWDQRANPPIPADRGFFSRIGHGCHWEKAPHEPTAQELEVIGEIERLIGDDSTTHVACDDGRAKSKKLSSSISSAAESKTEVERRLSPPPPPPATPSSENMRYSSAVPQRRILGSSVSHALAYRKSVSTSRPPQPPPPPKRNERDVSRVKEEKNMLQSDVPWTLRTRSAVYPERSATKPRTPDPSSALYAALQYARERDSLA